MHPTPSQVRLESLTYAKASQAGKTHLQQTTVRFFLAGAIDYPGAAHARTLHWPGIVIWLRRSGVGRLSARLDAGVARPRWEAAMKCNPYRTIHRVGAQRFSC